MKIKSDFVTNSSSTAYIVFIPTNFNPSEGDVLQAIKVSEEYTVEWDLTPEELEKMTAEVFDAVETLKIGESVCLYDGYSEISQTAWNACLELCDSFVLTHVDIPGEGSTLIQGVPENTVLNVFSNTIDLTKLMSNIIKEEKS